MTILTMMRPYCYNTQLAVIVIALTRRLSQQPTATVMQSVLLLRDMSVYFDLFLVKRKRKENIEWHVCETYGQYYCVETRFRTLNEKSVTLN